MPDQNLKHILVDDNFNLYVEFEDGEKRSVNLQKWIEGKSKIKEDINFCKKAFIEHNSVISWPEDISIDPEIIYEEGKKIKDFPKLKKTASYIEKIKSLSH